MNADIPPIRCFVREKFLNGKGGVEECYLFGISSLKGRALGFHAMLRSGAHFRHLPAHAICFEPAAPQRELEELCMWDCFSYRPVVWVADFLKDHEAICVCPGGSMPGDYLFTVDWLPDSHERPGLVLIPDQMKCAHAFRLADGNLCYLPTNRIAWKDGYWLGTDANPKERGYLVQEEVYQAETSAWNCTKDAWSY